MDYALSVRGINLFPGCNFSDESLSEERNIFVLSTRNIKCCVIPKLKNSLFAESAECGTFIKTCVVVHYFFSVHTR